MAPEKEDAATSSKNNVALAIIGAPLLLTVAASPFLIIPAFRRLGAIPWMVTPNGIVKKAVAKVVERSRARSTAPAVRTGRKRFVDLGSGDGRLVIAAAEAGYDATGIELNPVLVGMSYVSAWRAGVLSKVAFRMKDFWSVRLNDFDVVR